MRWHANCVSDVSLRTPDGTLERIVERLRRLHAARPDEGTLLTKSGELLSWRRAHDKSKDGDIRVIQSGHGCDMLDARRVSCSMHAVVSAPVIWIVDHFG
jgi:hypothetical protein